MTSKTLAKHLITEFPWYLRGMKAISRSGYDYAFDIQNTKLAQLYRVQNSNNEDDSIAVVQARITEFLDDYNLKWGFGSHYEYLFCWYR